MVARFGVAGGIFSTSSHGRESGRCCPAQNYNSVEHLPHNSKQGSTLGSPGSDPPQRLGLVQLRTRRRLSLCNPCSLHTTSPTDPRVDVIQQHQPQRRTETRNRQQPLLTHSPSKFNLLVGEGVKTIDSGQAPRDEVGRGRFRSPSRGRHHPHYPA